jgi:hypothetical protein
MNRDFTSEQEKIVKEELKTSHFRTVEEVIAEALQALRERKRSAMFPITRCRVGV